MIAEFKAPYAIALIIIIVVSALVMIIHGSIDSTAFKVAALLAGGMVARGLLAINVGALNTALLMASSAMVLLLATLFFLDANTFKDHAIEGITLGTFTGALMMVGELLERHRKEGLANG